MDVRTSSTRKTVRLQWIRGRRTADDRAMLARHADVAQLVEHHLAKVRVAGSSPVVRSNM